MSTEEESDPWSNCITISCVPPEITHTLSPRDMERALQTVRNLRSKPQADVSERSTKEEEQPTTSVEDEKEFTWYFMDYKSKEEKIEKKVFTNTTWEAAKKTIFSSCTVFSLDVVREVETDYITVFFEETTFEEGRNEELFNKSAVWIAKHLPKGKEAKPDANFVIARKKFFKDDNGNEVEENVDVDLSKEEIEKLLKSYSQRKSVEDFKNEKSVFDLKEFRVGWSGYLLRQRSYHNYITVPFLKNKKNEIIVSNALMQIAFPGTTDRPGYLYRVTYEHIYASPVLESLACAAGKILLDPMSMDGDKMVEQCRKIYEIRCGTDVLRVEGAGISAFHRTAFKTMFGMNLNIP